MDKPTCCLELTSSGIKLLIGYVYMHKVYVMHALESNGACLVKGNIIDGDQMTLAIKELVNSASKTLGIKIDSVVLGLPSIDLSVEQAKSETNTTDAESHVSAFDGSNCLAMITKQKADEEGKRVVVDVVPYEYYLDKDVPYKTFPLNKISRSLGMEADVEIMDGLLIKSFSKCVNNAGLQIEKLVNTTNAAIRYISSFQKTVGEFVYIDIGSCLTTIGYAYDSRLSRAETISFGSNDISSSIAKKFNIPLEKANRCKEVYGIASDPSFAYQTEDGIKISAIGETIKSSLSPLINAIQQFIMTIDASARNLFVISGGGADLIGLDQYLSNTFQNRVALFTPTCYGARSKSYTNCVAMLDYFAEYEIKTSSSRPVDLTLTRITPIDAITKEAKKADSAPEEKSLGDEQL
jgi:cell division protein FtsA